MNGKNGLKNKIKNYKIVIVIAEKLANPVKDWWKPPDIDFSVTALYDSDNEVGNAEDLYEEDDEDEEVADDEENFD